MNHLKLWENFDMDTDPIHTTNSDPNHTTDPFLNGYLTACLWSSALPMDIIEKEASNGNIVENYDDVFSIENFTDESIIMAKQLIEIFKTKAGSLLDGIEPSQIGHDLWLTMDGHGAGFWDRGLGEIGTKLTSICDDMTKLTLEDDGNGNLIFR